jgi:cell division protein ZapA (FtsZ GTPase activity inhibitor)
MGAQQYAITVFGQSFHITSEKSEDEVRTVAAYVDRKMRERARESRTIMPLRVAIMTALGIAEELLEKNGEGLRP